MIDVDDVVDIVILQNDLLVLDEGLLTRSVERVERRPKVCVNGLVPVVQREPVEPDVALIVPLLDYLDHIQSRGDDQMVTIVLPEFLPRHWWQHVLHNQTALLVKGALLYRKNTVVADVPYLLRR